MRVHKVTTGKARKKVKARSKTKAFKATKK